MSDVYDLDAAIAEEDFKPFKFTLGGKPYELPHVQEVPTELAMNIEEHGPGEYLEELAGAELYKAIMTLPAHGTEKLITQWFAHAGLKPGESQG